MLRTSAAVILSMACAFVDAAQQSTTAARDDAVIAAALLDMRAAGAGSPLESRLGPSGPRIGPSGPPFAVGTVAYACSGAEEAIYRLVDLDKLRAHGDQTREAVADAGRAGRADARIGSVPEGFELLEQSRSLFDRNILVCIPGYSKDGRLAVVLMQIQWSIHPLPTAQVLVEEDGRWRVVERSFGEPVFGTIGP